jgi:uncharacterized protein involved in response to NO
MTASRRSASPPPPRPEPLTARERGWGAARLVASPHRLCFAAAMAMLAATALGWGAVWIAGARAMRLPWALPPALAHALSMGFGFMPLFIVGFLFTAGPRWLQQPAPPARVLIPAVAACLLGWLVFGVGVLSAPGIAAAGLALVALGLADATRRFVRLLLASVADEREHAGLIAVAAAVGVLALVVAAFGLATDRLALAAAALRGALWSSIALTYVTAMHRLVPFFGAAAVPWLDARWPRALLGGLVLAVALQGLIVFAGVVAVLPVPLLAMQAALDGVVALLVFALAWRWTQVQPRRPRLPTMLHLGLIWFGAAFAFSAADAALRLGLPLPPLRFDLASVHALAMGFMGSLLLAMVTRVSCAHSGRAVVADDVLWRLFWTLQLAVAARVGAVLLPTAAHPLVALAALAWTGCMTAWAARSIRWYLGPRADGRPG